MALLIVDLDKRIGNTELWLDTLEEQLPDMEVRIWPDAANWWISNISPSCIPISMLCRISRT